MSKTLRDERELLSKARLFDQEALGEIYDHHSPGIFRYAYRLLGNHDLAEECVAETFARYLKALRTGGGPNDHLQAYLYRIAHNLVTDSYRRNAPVSIELDERLVSNSEAQPERQSERNAELDHMRLALRSLTPDQRLVVSLKFLEGWENERVAASLNKPVGAVKALQHRALQALRRILDPKDSIQ